MKITMNAIIERQRARIYTQKAKIIAKRLYLQKAKKTNPVYVRNTSRALLSNKIVFLHYCKKSTMQ